MGVLGTGVAAGVAQATLQGQQQARRRDRVANDTAAKSREARESMEVHLLALEEGDNGESVDRVHIDEQIPGHQNLPPDQPEHHAPIAAAETVAEEEQPDSVTTQEDGDELYHHLDLKA